MMVDLKEIHPLTDFQRNTKAHLKRLKKTGKPQVLTVNGHAEIVVQDAEAYQKLLEAVDRAEALEGIRQGLEDVKAGRTRQLTGTDREAWSNLSAASLARAYGDDEPEYSVTRVRSR